MHKYTERLELWQLTSRNWAGRTKYQATCFLFNRVHTESKVNKRHFNTSGNFVLSALSQWYNCDEKHITQNGVASYSAHPIRTWLDNCPRRWVYVKEQQNKPRDDVILFPVISLCAWANEELKRTIQTVDQGARMPVVESQWRLILYDATYMWNFLPNTRFGIRILTWFPEFKKFRRPALDELEQDIRNNYLHSPNNYKHNARYMH